jgi:hypothetical protein
MPSTASLALFADDAQLHRGHAVLVATHGNLCGYEILQCDHTQGATINLEHFGFALDALKISNAEHGRQYIDHSYIRLEIEILEILTRRRELEKRQAL